jgi:hypothetical protein
MKDFATLQTSSRHFWLVKCNNIRGVPRN